MHRDSRASAKGASSSAGVAVSADAFDSRVSHKKIDTFSPALAAVSRGCRVYSPVTELTLDFKDLSGFSETPKRRLSLSSLETPTPGTAPGQSPKAKRLSCASDGCADACTGSGASSPIEEESSEAGRRTREHRQLLKRVVSLPVFDIDDQVALPPLSPEHLNENSTPGRTMTIRVPEITTFMLADAPIALDQGMADLSSESSSPSPVARICGRTSGGNSVDGMPSPIPLQWDFKRPSEGGTKRKELRLGASIFRPQEGGAFRRAVADDFPLLQSSLCSTCDRDSDDDDGDDDDDDGYHDICENDGERGGCEMPGSIATLLSAPVIAGRAGFVETPSRKRSLFRSPSVPNLPRCRSHRTAKRPDPPVHHSDGEPAPAASKRRRPAVAEVGDFCDGSRSSGDADAASGTGLPALCNLTATASQRDILTETSTAVLHQQSASHLQRCKSMVEQSVQFYMTRTDDSVDMTGDLVTPCCLPLVKSKHGDLRCISSQTMAKVLQGEFRHVVSKCHVIDCRYPYEFASGHIKGAINLYSKDDVFEEFLKQPPALLQQPRGNENDAGVGRTILIFHCEFSSERGPRLSRFLRNHDRQSNKEHYPWLFYPEIYLLEGGYKAFYECHPDLCEPQAYKPMLHPDHTAELRQFRQKSKSWCGGSSDGSGGAGGSAGARVPLRPSLTLSW